MARLCMASVRKERIVKRRRKEGQKERREEEKVRKGRQPMDWSEVRIGRCAPDLGEGSRREADQSDDLAVPGRNIIISSIR